MSSDDSNQPQTPGGLARAEGAPAPGTIALGPAAVASARELYWQNLIREMLVKLATIRLRRPISTTVGPYSPPAGEPDFFDGRLAVITSLGQRIPIAGVEPAVACNIMGNDRGLANAVECTVFRILSPTGETYTLPVHEIRSFHALTDELVNSIVAASTPDEEPETPFGFEAFTSLAKEAVDQEFVHATTIVGPGFRKTSPSVDASADGR